MISEMLFKVERWGKQYPDEHRVAFYVVDAERVPPARLVADLRATAEELRFARAAFDLGIPIVFPGCQVVWAGEPIEPVEIPKDLQRMLKAITPFFKRKG